MKTKQNEKILSLVKILSLAKSIEESAESALSLCEDYDIKKDLRYIQDDVQDIIEELTENK